MITTLKQLEEALDANSLQICFFGEWRLLKRTSKTTKTKAGWDVPVQYPSGVRIVIDELDLQDTPHNFRKIETEVA